MKYDAVRTTAVWDTDGSVKTVKIQITKCNKFESNVI